MKTTIAATAAVVFVLATGIIAPPSHASHTDVSFDFFYSDLSPHGNWMVSADYGRVWQPRVYNRGWNPYYDGHWQYADVGWVWVSDYSWGAVPYHYGTWVEDPRFGWVWVPGYTWAPAWVVFRTGYDAIGWAPVAPGFSVGVSLDFGTPVASSFIFVSTRDFAAPRIRPYVVNDYRRTTYVNNTTIINNNLRIENNVVINRGPDVRVVERASGRRFKAAPVETVARVAPFQAVRREQLAVARDRIGRGARATEPVSAKRPLPQMGDRTSVIQQQQQREQAEPQFPRQRSDRQQQQQQREQPQRRDLEQPPQQREQQLQRERPQQEPQKQAQPQKQNPREQQLQRERPQQQQKQVQPPKPQPQERKATPPKAKPKSKKQDKKDADKEGGGGGGTDA